MMNRNNVLCFEGVGRIGPFEVIQESELDFCCFSEVLVARWTSECDAAKLSQLLVT